MSETAARVRSDLDRLLPLIEPALLAPLAEGEAPRVGEAMRYTANALKAAQEVAAVLTRHRSGT